MERKKKLSDEQFKALFHYFNSRDTFACLPTELPDRATRLLYLLHEWEGETLENIRSKQFLLRMDDRLIGIVVDESHCVVSW